MGLKRSTLFILCISIVCSCTVGSRFGINPLVLRSEQRFSEKPCYSNGKIKEHVHKVEVTLSEYTGKRKLNSSFFRDTIIVIRPESKSFYRKKIEGCRETEKEDCMETIEVINEEEVMVMSYLSKTDELNRSEYELVDYVIEGKEFIEKLVRLEVLCSSEIDSLLKQDIAEILVKEFNKEIPNDPNQLDGFISEGFTKYQLKNELAIGSYTIETLMHMGLIE